MALKEVVPGLPKGCVDRSTVGKVESWLMLGKGTDCLWGSMPRLLEVALLLVVGMVVGKVVGSLVWEEELGLGQGDWVVVGVEEGVMGTLGRSGVGIHRREQYHRDRLCTADQNWQNNLYFWL